MPLSHKKLSAWYHQLAQHLDAGLPFAIALRATVGAGAPAAGLNAMADSVENGGSLDDALRLAGAWLPEADILFLSAAAETGRLPRVLRNLSTRHAQFGAAKLRVMLACAYPLAILHLGLILFPLLRMIDWEKGFQWDAAFYARTLAVTLIPLWLVGVVLIVLLRRQSPWLTQLALLLPGFRGYVIAQALADFSFALGNFLDAGLPIDRAWIAAGLVSRSRDLRAASNAMGNEIKLGGAPGTKLSAWHCFPDDFIALYRAGETTGQLEQNLLTLAGLKQERANNALKLATLLYPGLLLVVVTCVIGYHVVSFYAGYFKMLGGLATP
jgi:type II secretory pathway component PulF